ncbi:helix-turn-helix transcriptional regulator [Streptomyces sp. NPDC000229]|uniref:helix-turn-helix transcriptional regulator n=1 Tax=Streptomyces sp. NPDC000229 TaxID=3154247 RepID=UPI00332CD301
MSGARSKRSGPACERKIDERLTTLITAVYPDERRRPGYTKLAQEIREVTGRAISGTYLWELATGKKSNVTLDHLEALAEFFGVPVEYFVNDGVARKVNAQLALASALGDAQVRNLALRANGLSPASLDALLTMVDEVRRLQGLTPTDGTEPASPPGRTAGAGPQGAQH